MTIFKSSRGFEQIFPTRDEHNITKSEVINKNEPTNNLDDFVSKYLFFKENDSKKMEKKFVNKMRRESSSLTMFCIHLVISFYIFLSLLYNLDSRISDLEIVTISFAAVFSLFNGFFVIIGMYIQESVSVDIDDSLYIENDCSRFISRFIVNFVPLLENVYLVSTNASVCLILLIAQLTDKKCDESYSMNPSSLLCISHQNMLHPTIVSVIWTLPFFLYATLRALKWLTVIITMVMNLTFIVVISVLLHLNVDLNFCLTIAPLVVICIVEYRRQSIQAFLSEEMKDKQVSKSEAYLIASHAVEMKHMIANIAHDMKTPLTAFISGVDVISSVVMDCEKIAIKENYRGGIQDKVVFVKDCIESIKHINAFMLMSINRCIDYTKASNGVKLVPRLETINLTDIITLPMLIMKDIQSKTTFNLKCLSDDICSHIITDGQWLQENILCLVSNAAKYSKNGTVDISYCIQKGSMKSSFLIKNTLRLEVDRGEGHHESTQDLIHSVDVDYNPSSISQKPASWGQIELGSLSLRFNGPIKEVGESVSEHLPGEVVTTEQDVRARFSSIDEEDGDHKVSADGGASSKDGPLFLHFEVEDNGIGISPDMLGSLFRPFKQAQRMTGGAGLGLYCLAKRVETLDGYFGVAPRRDGEQGSLFWFEIPYRPDEESAARWKPKEMMLTSVGMNTCESLLHSPLPSEKGNNNVLASGGGGGGGGGGSGGSVKGDNKEDYEAKILNILVVDDSPPILKMTSMMLRKNGHVVTVAEDGVAALEQVKAFRKANNRYFDVILMDLQMPVMDGLEATKRIRSIDIAKTPVSSKGKSSFHTRDDFLVIANSSQRLHSRRMSIGSPIAFDPPLPKRRGSSFSIASNFNYEVVAWNDGGDAISENGGSGSGSLCEPGKSFIRTSISPVKKPFGANIMDSIALLPFELSGQGQENSSDRPTKAAPFPIHSMPLTVSSTRTCFNYQYIIGVSANSDADTIQQAFVAGVDAFIPKPFTLQSFNTTFAKLKFINSDITQSFRDP